LYPEYKKVLKFEGGNISLPVKSILTLIFFSSLFAGWGEHPGKQGWPQAGENMCGALKKSGAFRDSAQDCTSNFKRSTSLKKNSHFFSLRKFIMHIYIFFLRYQKVHDVILFATKNYI
jgi:hypothetical protein